MYQMCCCPACAHVNEVFCFKCQSVSQSYTVSRYISSPASTSRRTKYQKCNSLISATSIQSLPVPRFLTPTSLSATSSFNAAAGQLNSLSSPKTSACFFTGHVQSMSNLSHRPHRGRRSLHWSNSQSAAERFNASVAGSAAITHECCAAQQCSDSYLDMSLLTLQTSPPRLGMRSTVDLASQASCFHARSNENRLEVDGVAFDCRWKLDGGWRRYSSQGSQGS